MDAELEIIKTATELITRAGNEPVHTVASAIKCSDGSIVTGVNLYHFTGGPCAELVALANLANDKKTPLMIVAVGDRGRSVLAPCGRCRQVLFDYYPEIQVVVMDIDKPVSKPIKELLPYVYDWNAEQTSEPQ